MLAKINGKEIFYEIYGEGQPLIFIHGLGVTHQMWKWQIEDLQNDFQVIVYDLPGHGQSENRISETNVYKGLADDLVGLMDHLGIGKANIVGLSLGGRLAIAMAVHYPERVAKLVISSTFEKLQGLKEKLRTWMGTNLLKKMTLSKIVESSASGFFPNPEHAEAAKIYTEEALKTDKSALIKLSEAAKEVDYSNNLKNIQQPTLVFAGEKETLMIKIAERIASQIPNAKIEIVPDVGHIWNMEKPQLFNRKLREFLL